MRSEEISRYNQGMKSDEKLHPYLVRLPVDLFERLREEAYLTRTPISEIVRKCLVEHYATQEKRGDESEA